MEYIKILQGLVTPSVSPELPTRSLCDYVIHPLNHIVIGATNKAYRTPEI